MSKKLILYVVLAVAIGIGLYAMVFATKSASQQTYKSEEITRGTIENTVSATGELSPLTVVDVGSQISGLIDTVLVDYNAVVRKGQLLARIDSTMLSASVKEAKANLAKAESALEEAEYKFNLNKNLFERGLISEADFVPYRFALKTQEASLESAQATLTRAEKNLEYASIYSPINGIVIEKNIEEGQTVAASLSAPTMFQIAEDLSRMEILVDVDESDIGYIKQGQKVRFEVQAYDDEQFTGVVSQIRLQPETISNVVTYTVVVEAENRDDLLLPGMTASVDFITESKDNVLTVPNKALRFTPDDETVAAFRERMTAKREEMQNSGEKPVFARPGGSGNPSVDMPAESEMAKIWIYDDKGQLAMVPICKGISDGMNTEVIDSPILAEGTKVIVGVTTGEESEQEQNSISMRQGPPPGMGPGF